MSRIVLGTGASRGVGAAAAGVVAWPSRRVFLTLAVVLAYACDGDAPERQAPIRVAVASNFLAPMKLVARAFQDEAGVAVTLSAGSTGKLYAQIDNGAPFDVFLAADTERPALLERRGLTAAGSRFTYAFGRLALYGPGLRRPAAGLDNLRADAIRHVAIANPDTAPYGLAARQVMERAGLWASLSQRLVRGENVAQTYQFVDTGAAELGFVALSSVIAGAKHPYWVVPSNQHEPMRQDAVLVRRGTPHPRAAELLQFLRGAKARRTIEEAGYSMTSE